LIEVEAHLLGHLGFEIAAAEEGAEAAGEAHEGDVVEGASEGDGDVAGG
jgi:hypothetical protein